MADDRFQRSAFRAYLSLWPWRALSLIALTVAALVPWRPELLSPYNLETLALAASLLAVLAIGQSLVMISGGIDLSLPAVISACSVAGAATLGALEPSASGNGGVALALVGMLALGLLIGLLQGLAVAYLKMPPLLVSLSMLMLVGGVTLWATQSNRYAMPESFTKIWYGRPVGIPVPLFVVGALAYAAHYTLQRTLLGRRLFAIGENVVVARIAGLPVERTVASCYAASGGCAALAGAFYSARLHTASPDLVENDVLLDCIAAAVIGGVSLFGGRGRIPGVLAGALFIALVGNGLNLLGLRYWHVLMVKGLMILLAVALDAWGMQRARFRGAIGP